MVYFLTEITENDLLNATSGNSETLPKNSAALESAIPAGKAHCQTITGKSRKIHSRRRKIPEKQKIRKMKKAQRKPSRRKKRQSRTRSFPISSWAHLRQHLSAELIISR